MRKILLFLLLTTGICNAQIVNIPDIGLRFNLSQAGYDTNGDNYIQVSEAEAVTELTLLYITAGSIHDFTGLEAFVNVTTFNCSKLVLDGNRF
ncbi:hypothetical protein [Flavobacterium sp.]|uniref:hypothetical protein n=1 Tax=Flavobacterium sp. TaxID=239 RepID=UPI0039E3FAFD